MAKTGVKSEENGNPLRFIGGGIFLAGKAAARTTLTAEKRMRSTLGLHRIHDEAARQVQPVRVSRRRFARTLLR